MTKTITIAYGDDINADLMQNSLQILQQAQIKVNFDIIEIGQNIFDKGFKPGLMPSAFDNINNSKILIKGPINNEEILDRTLIKNFNLNVNIEEIKTLNPLIDIALIHGNEDVFLDQISYQQHNNLRQNISFINQEQYQNTIHQAFSYALKNNRSKISFVTKKDDLFIDDFIAISKNYPQITTQILDLSQVISQITTLDVILTSNINANIISKLITKSDIRSRSNINDKYGIFDINQQQESNISKQASLINATTMMLAQIKEFEIGNNIKNALLKTLEEESTSNIDEFIKKIIDNLDKKPTKFRISNYQNHQITNIKTVKSHDKTLIGFDLFIDWPQDFTKLISNLNKLESDIFEIKTISQNNQLLWPLADVHLRPEIQNSPFCLRFIGKNISKKSSIDIIDSKKSITQQEIVDILQIFSKKAFDFIKFEGLYHSNSTAQYLANQGEKISDE